MAGQTPTNSVWSAMSYQPPRGRCNHKSSLMLPACPCLRFMLHPVKAATSFECDGCNHHASFHSLENQAEDVILKKWAEQEASTKSDEAVGGATKKRKLLTQAATDQEASSPDAAKAAATKQRASKAKPRRRQTTDEDDDVQLMGAFPRER